MLLILAQQNRVLNGGVWSPEATDKPNESVTRHKTSEVVKMSPEVNVEKFKTLTTRKYLCEDDVDGEAAVDTITT
jgi:hypothetical protein